jgi:tetratricopeptide (TPR) repeat protein
MNKHLLLTVVAGVALSGLLRADDAAPAAASGTAAPAAAAPATTPVAKNDAPGSLAPGKQLLDEAKYADAAAYFEGIGEQTTSNGATKREPYRQNDLSLAYLNLGKYDQAIAAASKAVELNKGMAVGWSNLAAAYGASGQRDKAVDALTKGVEAVKGVGGDSGGLEAKLKSLQDLIESGKPKAEREADAKATATAASTAAASAATPAAQADTAKAAAPAADASAAK